MYRSSVRANKKIHTPENEHGTWNLFQLPGPSNRVKDSKQQQLKTLKSFHAFQGWKASMKTKGAPPVSELPRFRHVFVSAKSPDKSPPLRGVRCFRLCLRTCVFRRCLPCHGLNPPIFLPRHVTVGSFFSPNPYIFFSQNVATKSNFGILCFCQFLTRGGKTTKKSSYPDFLLAQNFTQCLFWLEAVALLNSPRFWG